MDWAKFMDETVKNIGVLAKEMPETAKAFNTMGTFAKSPVRWTRKPKRSWRLALRLPPAATAASAFM